MSPSGSIDDTLRHTFRAPAFAEATVLDAMRVGVVSCTPDTPLREVARILATYRIHAVVLTEIEGARPWGIVSDLDVVGAAGHEHVTARDIVHEELVTVAPDDSLFHAAQQMTERGVTHAVVVQPHSGQPVGVLSTLDLVGVLAWGGTN